MTKRANAAKGTETNTSLIAAFGLPAARTMFLFGFASGLPFLLVGGTLSVWLKDSGISLESIGLISLASLAYAFKFLWAPLVDRWQLPVLRRLGRRRGWLVFAQALLALCLVLMSLLSPSGGLALFVCLTVVAGWAGATQDVVVDAYRIEIAPMDVQGALAATYTLGYRMALLVSGALALLLADHLPWSLIYQAMATIVVFTIVVTLFSPEPKLEASVMVDDGQPLLRSLASSIVGPFRDFFSRYGGSLGWGLLLFIGLFKVSDQMLGVMALPFYLDVGFTKTEIAGVSKLFGVWVGIAGAFIGGAAVVRYGAHRMLLVAILLGAASNLLYVVLALFPGNLTVFVAVIGGENLSGGFLGSVAVAWLSALVSREYTASQYALFSSLVALPGKLIGGVSGFMVTGMGYSGFFIFSTAAGVPALLLYLWLSKKLPSETVSITTATKPLKE
ncbi:AmpG family muropeptide MFS transporter [Paraperlucidibaca wandonensis]|mgnify:CR=1 FL=1|jgi:PAT family beta-lactamase induction signal transducer AmpG|uniref:AmpG family muropeptide MFS transporter n=1 Tax=Paraperlucidibaca wandonensis TaxID=1268273 RepID=A0ABW3HC75_9GAMM|tara:strand:+ start:2165 stop:3505 length:1341 start_codon:yes stop_codon:yes gene_type:complete